METQHAGATHTAPPTLNPRSPSSFAGTDPQALAAYLIINGYDVERGHSTHEYARLWNRGSLVILYHTGTALVQGKREPSISLLSSLSQTGGLR